MVLETFKKGVGIIIHPNKEAHVNLGFKEALLTYYKFAAVPMVLTLLASLVVVATLPGVLSSVPSNTLVGGSVALTIFVYRQFLFSLILTPLIIPVGLFFIAALLHIIGKTIRLFEGNFARTFTAVVYAEFSSLLFWFAFAFGTFGSIIYFLSLIYGVYVLVIGLSKQHKTSGTNAFIVGLIAFVFLAIVASVFVSAYVAGLQGSGALPGG